MKASWILAGCLLASGLARAGSLDVRGWVDRPGTKLLAVEFYATWCEPCMKAVPKWKVLHEKYRTRGLRLVVVSTMDHDGQCVNPGWMPDETVCDPEGQIADAFGLQGKLPAAFLWSWDGHLLAGKGHVEEVERVVEQYLAKSPRVLVEVAEGQTGGRELRDLVREQLSSRGKLELVASEGEGRELLKLKQGSFQARFDDKLQCEMGQEVPANSLLRVSVDAGKQPRLGLMLFSAESGCLLAAATVPWQPEQARRAVAEAVDKLLSRLRAELQLPGVVERPAVRKFADAKRKAQLWLEFAQSPFVGHEGQDKLKAYNKAIELDPELAAAYLGRADTLRFMTMGMPSSCEGPEAADPADCRARLAERQKKAQDALSDIDRAIALDDANPEAYAQRVELLLDMKEHQPNVMLQSSEEDNGELDKALALLDQRLMDDINRAIALGSASKPFLYEQRAILNAQAKKPDRAVADMTQAIQSKEAEKPGVPYYHGHKALEAYYLARANLHEGADKERRRGQDLKKADEFYQQRKKKEEQEEKEVAALMEKSELGKLQHELRVGALQKATGLSSKELVKWTGGDRVIVMSKFKPAIRKIKDRIESGKATAEEYLFLAGPYADEDTTARDRYQIEAIRLLKAQASDSRRALMLIDAYTSKVYADLQAERFDEALSSLNDARAIVDAHSPRVLDEFVSFVGQRGEPPRELILKMARLGREDAEALYWWIQAMAVGHLRVQVFEKLGLTSKARDEYKYLCALKDQDACRNLERVK